MKRQGNGKKKIRIRMGKGKEGKCTRLQRRENELERKRT